MTAARSIPAWLLAATAILSLGVRAQNEPAGAARSVRESPDYEKERGGPAPHLRTSAHFALRWGEDNQTNVTLDDAYTDKALAWLEDLWSLYIDRLHFPAGRHGYKINAYMTRTGLKPFLEGYAFGMADPQGYGTLVGEPSIFTYGHNGAAHEFAHALQGETGGFRNSDYVGWFWECHAQFLAHQATGKSDLPHVLDRYAQTSQWDIASTRHHYGSWIFFQYLAERYPDGMAMVNRLWTEPPRNRDEDAIAKLRRTLPLRGDRDTAWADLIGDYARRNVAWNFYKLGPEYRSSLKFFDEMSHRNYFTYLEPSPARPGWWRVPRIYAPQQNGYNIVPLTPRPGATRKRVPEVQVELAGFVEPALRSAWRATLVAVDSRFRERYSATWRAGIGELAVRPDERVFLVVAATPLKHSPPRFVERFPDIPCYPYEIRCSGAAPRSLSARIRPLPSGVKSHRHPNGGGTVADSATVAATAFVGPNAAVLDRARVEEAAHVEDFATVSGEARVSGSAVVAGNALVTGRARVEDEALITDFAEIDEDAQVHGRARVFAAGRVFGRNEITDEAVVKGFASIRGVRRLRGGAIADGEVEWDFTAPELATGIHFGTLLQKDAERPERQEESHHLYARYPMDGDSAWRLRDAFGANDGVLQGGARIVADPGRGRALALSGRGQFADLPRELALHRQMTVAGWVWLDSARPEQRIAAFGRDEGHVLELLAADGSGHLGVRLRRGAAVTAVSGPRPPLRRWLHVAATVGDAGLALYVDGRRVAQKAGAVHPDDLRSARGFLGRGLTGGFLAGRLHDVAFFTRSLSDAEVAERSK